MQASDVTETLDLARAQAGVDRVRVVHRPRLLSDNGPCYISQELADYLDTHGLVYVVKPIRTTAAASQERLPAVVPRGAASSDSLSVVLVTFAA